MELVVDGSDILKGFWTIGLQVEHYCECEKNVVAPGGPVCVKPETCPQGILLEQVFFNGSMRMSVAFGGGVVMLQEWLDSFLCTFSSVFIAVRCLQIQPLSLQVVNIKYLKRFSGE